MAGVLGNRITTTIHQNIDPRSLNHVIGIPIRSTKGLLLSKPCKLNYPLSTASSKTNGIKRKHSFAVLIKNYGRKLIKITKHRLSYGAKVIQFGSQDKMFKKNFSIQEGEKLLQGFQCHLYTTVGAIAGVLFVSTERVAFCSYKSIKTYSTTGKQLKFQFKVSIPLGKINEVNESMSLKMPSNNYVELVTIDAYSFWFMGFLHYKKALRCLHQATSLACKSTS